MNNKKITIDESTNEILELIAKTHGIEIINGFVKTYNKKLRKQQTRVNYYDEIAMSVYQLVHEDKYSKTRAIDKIAEDNNISDKTVRNHCAKFDKEAKKFDFYSFGYLVDEALQYAAQPIYQVIEALSNLNELEIEIGEIYYFKYKKLKGNKKDFIVDTDKFKKTYHFFNDDVPF